MAIALLGSALTQLREAALDVMCDTSLSDEEVMDRLAYLGLQMERVERDMLELADAVPV